MDKRRRTGCPAGTEQKINGGATLDSLRTDLAEKEKAAADAEGKKLQILRKNRRRFPKAPILWKLLRKRLAALMCNPLQQRNGNGVKRNTFRTESSLQTEKEFEEASFLFSLS